MFLVAFFLALRERSGRRPAARERSPLYIYIYIYIYMYNPAFVPRADPCAACFTVRPSYRISLARPRHRQVLKEKQTKIDYTPQ